MSLAKDWLRSLHRAHPEITHPPAPPGMRRGIDVYKAEAFLKVVEAALENFRELNGRYPDPVALPESRDYFFLMKFFMPVPMPSPADKLGVSAYLPEEMAPRIFVPARPWISTAPVLPPDDAVPAGRYYLKLALGFEHNLPLAWPPSPAEREKAAQVLNDWFSRRFGPLWGEWWYGIGEQRAFLEEDLSARMAGRAEVKIYVREGRPVLGYKILHDFKTRVHGQRYFDANLRPLDGLTVGYRFLPPELPERIEEMLAIAGAVGRRFRLVRVDFLDLDDQRPCLGELTLCDQNASRRYAPPEFDRVVKRLLFDRAPERAV